MDYLNKSRKIVREEK